MSLDTEIDDLDALTMDDGWKRFVAFVNDQWGAEAVERRMEQAVGEGRAGDEAGANETVASIIYAKRHIRHLLNWPRERVDLLRTKEQATPVPARHFSRTRERFGATEEV